MVIYSIGMGRQLRKLTKLSALQQGFRYNVSVCMQYMDKLHYVGGKNNSIMVQFMLCLLPDTEYKSVLILSR